MHMRTAYIRRSRKSQRLKRRLAAVALSVVAGCAALLFVTRTPPSPPLAANDVSAIVDASQLGAQAGTQPARAWQAAAPAAPKTVRRVYPYSVVPGGVAGRDDVVRVMTTDKVVADHYASFQVDKARVTTVSKPRAVYVSYRKADKVFWTAGKHMLAAGETLLTDGSNEIRGRCGNRVSDVAMLPVEAQGPSEAELDAASDEAVDGDAGSAENVSFTADSLADSGGHAFVLNNFYGAGLLRGTAADGRSGANGGLGLPSMPDLAEMMRIANSGVLLAKATQANGTGTGAGNTDTGSGGSGGTPPASTPAPGEGTGSSSGGTGDPGSSNGGSDSGGTTGSGGGGTGGSGGGNTGGNTGGAPSTDPVIPVPQTPPEKPDGGLPEVLQPTQPVPVPPKDDGKDDSNDVAEPGSLWLAGVGFAGVLLARRRRRG